MKILNNIKQRSPEWYQKRLGSIGGSEISQLVGGEKGFNRLVEKKKYEIMFGKEEDSLTFQSDAMRRGVELESKAIDHFCFLEDKTVANVGLITGDIERTHVSPDGLIIGEKAGLEVKCPLLSTYEKYENGKIPVHIIRQVQYGMFITGWKLWYLFIFHPDTPCLILPIASDNTMHELFKQKLKQFNEVIKEWTDTN